MKDNHTVDKVETNHGRIKGGRSQGDNLGSVFFSGCGPSRLLGQIKALPFPPAPPHSDI